MATVKEIVFEALDNYLAEGVDYRDKAHDCVTGDLVYWDADVELYVISAKTSTDSENRLTEIGGYVEEWQLKQRTP